MNIKKFYFKAIVCLTILSLNVSVHLSVSANDLTNKEKLIAIQKVMYESTIEDLMTEVEDIAVSEGLNYSTALEKVYQETIAEEKEWSQSDNAISGGSVLVKHAYTTPPAAEIGDIYFTQATTYKYSHGHVGMYHYSDNIVQAPGKGKLSNIKHRSESNIVKGYSIIGRVMTTLTNRRASANYAKTYYVNKPYDENFLNNKKVTSKLNCSGLVWFAYKKGASLNLDKDGGRGVYPRDIIYHKDIDRYKWL